MRSSAVGGGRPAMLVGRGWGLGYSRLTVLSERGFTLTSDSNICSIIANPAPGLSRVSGADGGAWSPFVRRTVLDPVCRGGGAGPGVTWGSVPPGPVPPTPPSPGTRGLPGADATAQTHGEGKE